MMREPVVAHLEKWGGVPHWELEMLRLGEDEHGTWLGWVPGARAQRFTEPTIDMRGDRYAVMVIPPDDWWMFRLNSRASRCEVYVDVAAPARWEPGCVRVIDLDLDVLRGWDGEVFFEDEDEFAEHQVRFGYPAEVIERARATAEQWRAQLEARDHPIESAARAWLERLCTTDGSRPA